MKNLRTIKNTLTLVAFLAIGVLFNSCSDDDDIPSPVIGDIELGIGDSHVAYIGQDLHMDVEILADGLIDVITVEIHKEDGTGEEIEAEYTEYAGLRNTDFHKHVDIPATMEAGEYHFHLTVTDQAGNSSSIEEDIMLEELVDEEAPELTITSAPTNGQSFADGETISISGTITDNIALAGMLVALVYEDDAIADADVTGSNSKVIVMAHTHDFDHPDETEFIASINVGAANDNNMTPAAIQGDNAWKSGNYYILVKSRDAGGNGVASSRYPIEISL